MEFSLPQSADRAQSQARAQVTIVNESDLSQRKHVLAIELMRCAGITTLPYGETCFEVTPAIYADCEGELL